MYDSSIASRGRVTAVLGPTNTGKTHLAVERMLGHESGMIGLPLRLLAREIYDRVVNQRGAQCVALITGEEKIIPTRPSYYVCTVEAMPLDIDVAFLAIDEIQLAADPERGHVFTHRLLKARGSQETMFLGAETMRPLLSQLVPNASFVTRPRFSDLAYTGPKKLTRLPRRSAIVAFSSDSVYSIAELIRRQRGGAAVVMGALSPRTRNAQVALYQSGDVDYMVATDAVGMGLNMDVGHVAFASMTKFDGRSMRALRPAEAAQIAGRAGRYLNDGTFGTTAGIDPMDEDLVEQIENHRFDPIRLLHWRNSDLRYGSLTALMDSLDLPPQHRGLSKARPAIDLQALRSLSGLNDIARMASAPAAIRRLWDVCQVPDFRKVMSEEHVRLLSQIYRDIMSDRGTLNPDWMAGHISKLDRTDGDLDTLASRIAHTRTWTYVTNRAGWIDDQAHWRERTRAIEDKLSDALHERLTQRFIDRRTSVLMKRMREDVDLLAAVNAEGEVTVEGEYVGRLHGFYFAPDPRAQGIHGKALRAAAMTALEPEIASRAKAVIAAEDAAIELTELGKLRWNGEPIARLDKGAAWLAPKIELIQAETLDAEIRSNVQDRLVAWVAKHIETVLEPLVQLHKTVEDKDQKDLTGLARGIGYQLVESFGQLDRNRVADEIRSLEQPDRQQLRRLGVRFGEYSVFMPKLLKPAAANLLLLLWRIAEENREEALPAPPTPGLCSVPNDRKVPFAFYVTAGYRPCGQRVVRVDMLERLAILIREEIGKGKTAKRPGPQPAPQTNAAPAAKEAETADTQPQTAETTQTSDTPSPSQDETAPEIRIVYESTGAPIRLTGAAAQPKPQKPHLRFGEFQITSDMMSLVGCSGEDFESILRHLGYRKRTVKAGDASEEIWKRLPPPGKGGKRPPRSKGKQSPKARAGKPKAKVQGPKHQKPATPKPKKLDPDSPFAALKALKDKS